MSDCCHYDEGYKDGKAAAEDDYERGYDNGYSDGCSDTWPLERKIDHLEMELDQANQLRDVLLEFFTENELDMLEKREDPRYIAEALRKKCLEDKEYELRVFVGNLAIQHGYSG